MKFTELELRHFGDTASLLFNLPVSTFLYPHEMRTKDLLTDIPESKVWNGSIRYELRKQAQINKSNGTTTIADRKAMDIKRHLDTMPQQNAGMVCNHIADHYIVCKGKMVNLVESGHRVKKTSLPDGIYKYESRKDQYIKIG